MTIDRRTSIAAGAEGRRKIRRLGLATAAVALVGAAIAPSCAASFDPPGQVSALRILSIDVDPPYAAPGEKVTFQMTVVDGLDRENERPVQIVWLGGCFDPADDRYYNCYGPLGDLLGQIDPNGELSTEFLKLGIGATSFELTLPEDIITRRPRPPAGAYSGIAYVFFAACAGQLGVVPAEGTGEAGSFPLGCFDGEGNRLGAESFVAGYTQVYAFEDGRINNAPEVVSFDLDGTPMSEDFAAIPTVEACTVDSEARRQSGCSAVDEFAECTAYELKVVVPESVGEPDPDGIEPDGTQLFETVWVSYFADGGNFDADTKLISDAKTGYADTQDIEWVPPTEPGTYRLWAVVRDSRGGSTTLQRFVNVQ